jgi:hypothetical protein
VISIYDHEEYSYMFDGLHEQSEEVADRPTAKRRHRQATSCRTLEPAFKKRINTSYHKQYSVYQLSHLEAGLIEKPKHIRAIIAALYTGLRKISPSTKTFP